MRQYRRNAPARPLTYCKSGVFKLWLAALAVLGLLAFTQVACAAGLTLLFDQSAYRGDVWIQVQDASATFAATYANGTQSISFTNQNPPPSGTVLMSVPVKLSDIGAGGLNVTFSSGALIYLFYDDPSGNSQTAAPAYITSTQRFQSFELTMTGGLGDQGDLTAINWFTAPLSISSYQNDPIQNPSESPLQQKGFGSNTAAQIGAQLTAAAGSDPSLVVKNGSGQIIRYLAPSDYNGTNPWPSFIPYTQSINTAGQTTTIKRTNQFNFAPPNNTTAYVFGIDMTANANADGSLSVTGNITATATGPIIRGNPTLPPVGYWTPATITFSVADVNAFNNAIYGQVQNSAVTFSGQAFTDFLSFTNNTLLHPGQPHNSLTNPNLNDNIPGGAGLAYNITLNMFVGEITTGLIGGFYNSNYPSNYPPDNGALLKNVPSSHWWLQSPIVAFSQIQPSNLYYNVYANVIFNTSNNTVYGVPFSDRFGTGPLVNSVQYNGTNVNYWKIGVGAPLGAPPPANKSLSGMLLLLLLGNQ